MEWNLTGREISCIHNVIGGEFDVFKEGEDKLRCLGCEVICSSGKDANLHLSEVHGGNVVGCT